MTYRFVAFSLTDMPSLRLTLVDPKFIPNCNFSLPSLLVWLLEHVRTYLPQFRICAAPMEKACASGYYFTERLSFNRFCFAKLCLPYGSLSDCKSHSENKKYYCWRMTCFFYACCRTVEFCSYHVPRVLLTTLA